MNERASRHEHPAVADNAAYRLACALVTLGEGKVAIDLMRRKVNAARRALTQPAPALFRVLTDYAAILESMDALAEAEFIRAEVLEIVAAEQQPTQDGVEALLRSGLLLCKMHNYDGAIARLREAVSGAEESARSMRWISRSSSPKHGGAKPKPSRRWANSRKPQTRWTF